MVVLLIFCIILCGSGIFVLTTKINGRKFNKRLRMIALFALIGGGIGAITSMALLQKQSDESTAAKQTSSTQTENGNKSVNKAEEVYKKHQEKIAKENARRKKELANAPTRHLPAQYYTLNPDTIYKMYNKDGQSFFDTQYDDNSSKNYALQHIGMYFPAMHFNTTTGQVATIDNLSKNKRKVILVVLGKDNGDYKANSSTMKLMRSLIPNYPEVNFITIFPTSNKSDVDKMMKENDMKDYGIIVTQDQNQTSVGNNLGNLQQFATQNLGFKNDRPLLIALDQNDRIALTNNDYSTFSQDNVNHMINLAFNGLPGQKAYNMLRSSKELQHLANENDQTFNTLTK